MVFQKQDTTLRSPKMAVPYCGPTVAKKVLDNGQYLVNDMPGLSLSH